MYVTDNPGSVVAAIDGSGHGGLTDPYTPYGLDAQPGSLDSMFTFTGALQDTVGVTSPGTGFLHLGNRWYRPPAEPNAGVGNETGPAHFTQPDSITQLSSPANANLYAYAADNPTNYIDPAGTSSCSEDIFGAISSGLGLVASFIGLVTLTPEAPPSVSLPLS